VLEKVLHRPLSAVSAVRLNADDYANNRHRRDQRPQAKPP
jgi:hypothetical protein